MTPNRFSKTRRWRLFTSQVLFVVCVISPLASAWADYHRARPVTPGSPPPPPRYNPPRPPGYRPAPPPAYPPYNPPPNNGWTRCETQARGMQFRDSGSNRQWAREQTIRSCAWSSSSEGECRYNLRCDNEYPGEWIRCQATSNGQWFFDGGLDYNFVRQGAIQRCEQSGFARPGECTAYVRCDSAGSPSPYPGQPGYPAPQPGYPDNRSVICSTQSQGRRFNFSGYGWWSTRASVINLCRNAGYTVAWECENNAVCR